MSPKLEKYSKAFEFPPSCINKICLRVQESIVKDLEMCMILILENKLLLPDKGNHYTVFSVLTTTINTKE